jgi:prophage antirepressor-like protein
MQLTIFKYQSSEEQAYHNFTTVEIEINGESWFVASEICKQLDLGNTSKAILPLDEDEKMLSPEPVHPYNQRVNIISESGLYTLIFKSRKPDAQKFRKWITKEVIPSIRKKGYYGKIDRSQVSNFHLRYKDNYHKIDRNYFSVISELFVTLNAELEKHGYQIPDKAEDGTRMMPDISVGLTFSAYLTKIKSPFKEEVKFYKHSFPDDRDDKEAKMYPIAALEMFRRFVFEVWIPKYYENYFKTRDPLALDYLPKLLEP